MKNRIFKKYVLISTSVITASFIILGVFLVILMMDYWTMEKTRELTKTMQSLSYTINENMVADKNGNVHIKNATLVDSFLSVFSKSCDADFFICDANGNVLSSSPGSPPEIAHGTVPENIINESSEQVYSRQGTLNGVYKTNCLIVSVPIKTSYTNETVAVIFAVARSQYLSGFFESATGAIVILFIIVLLISLFAIGLLNYKTLKPLKQLADATNSFAHEDFSVRVDVKRNDEVGQLASALNNMAETLSHSENTRRSFIANVSHELKTPMTTISGFVDGILDRTIPKEKQEHYLSIVSTETKRLSRLVDSMLNISRIDSNGMKIQFTQTEILRIITEIVLSFEKQIADKNIQIKGLENSKEFVISADKDMLHQAIYNLVENAVKFTDVNGYIDFSLRQLEEKNIEIKIKNSCSGIPKEKLQFIFDRFYKTDESRSKDKKGLGLGLYIVKKIINMHSGTVVAKSVEGEYCEFVISIPTEQKEG